jgi:hypothetical protein
MKRISSILFGFFLAFSAHARCTNVLYALSGSVTEAPGLLPIAGADVTVQWTDFAKGRIFKAVSHTDEAGRYSASVPFRPWSGNTHGHDVCSAKLLEVSVTVAAHGFERHVQKEPIAGAVSTANYSLKRTAANRLGVD